MPRRSNSELAPSLAEVAGLGPYFEIHPVAGGGGWSAFADLPGDPVTSRVHALRRAFADHAGAPVDEIDLRACASTDLLGLLSRVLSPALALASVVGVVPALEPRNVLWRASGSGPVSLAWTNPTGHSVHDAAGAAAALRTGVLDPVVTPLVAAYLAGFGLSPKVAWGNVASALAGAAGIISRAAVPTLIAPGDVVEMALRHGKLTGTGRYRPTGFARHNCCLFYRLPGGVLCGDCVLDRSIGR